jgi:4,5-DOPA dioxygenase extradiol
MALLSLFLSHGAPTLPLTDTPARTFLSQIGNKLERPKAILVISAHWETAVPTVNAVDSNETIHDFGGFPRALYDLRYPAPGSPKFATRVAERLRAGGFDCNVDRRRGLDHGAWVPLLLMYLKADIPVLQLSVQPHLGPEHHLRVGRALAPLRSEGVLIIGSGSFTHDLSEFRGHNPNDPAPNWVNSFADWFDAALAKGHDPGLRQSQYLRFRRAQITNLVLIAGRWARRASVKKQPEDPRRAALTPTRHAGRERRSWAFPPACNGSSKGA